jgi:heme exporter protein A
MSALVLDGLRRDYGERPGLPQVSLTLEPGRTLAVIGANGSGKTTLLRILAGLLRPSGGAAAVLGCELPRETWRLRGRIGYLGDRPMLYRDLSARENLRFSARLHGLGRGPAEARIEELLDAVELGRRGDDRVAELSAGMAQRVAVCGAVLHRPELLLLDEPESHLDQGGREAADRLLSPPAATRVIATHERERAAAADAVLELG